MRCKNCPAYWEDVTPMVGVEDWGCYCNEEVVKDNLTTESLADLALADEKQEYDIF